MRGINLILAPFNRGQRLPGVELSPSILQQLLVDSKQNIDSCQTIQFLKKKLDMLFQKDMG